jgi:hypothetical protein
MDAVLAWPICPELSLRLHEIGMDQSPKRVGDVFPFPDPLRHDARPRHREG